MSGAKTLLIPTELVPERLARFHEEITHVPADATMLIIRSEGEAESIFCKGLSLASVSPKELEPAIRDFEKSLLRLRSLPMLTIAAVNGSCMGGGLALAALCDWVIATEPSKFSLPELWSGLYPAMVYPCLLERMPAQKARALAYLGSSIDAAGAALYGLVDERVDAGKLESALKSRIRKFERLDREALAEFKRYAVDESKSYFSADGVHQGAEKTLQRAKDPEVARRLAEMVAKGKDE